MGHPKTQVFASELLVSVAPKASSVLFPVAINNKSGLAAEIAIRLKHIADELSKQKLYQLSPYTQSLSSQALQDMVKICNWSTLSTPRHHNHLTESNPQELRDLLDQILETKKSKDCMQSIEKFCKEKPDTIKPFQLRFIVLYNELIQNAQALQGPGTEIAAYSHLRPHAEDAYSDEVNKLLLDGARSSASCLPKHHRTPIENDMHLTRLCLSFSFRFKDQSALFDIITTTSTIMRWQEMAFSVPIKKIALDPSELSLFECGDLCKRLEDPSFAKMYLNLDENCNLYLRPDPEQLQYIISYSSVQLSELLKQCELTVEQKIKLSYAVARAFWQFYSSELMSTRWTSEDILFYPIDEKIDKEIPELKRIPLRAFVSFPFGTQYMESPAEFCDKEPFTHRYPRILHLGIVLLEIGLGQTLGLERDSKYGLLAHMNLAHIKAKKKLEELKKAKWDSFGWKHCFVEAVENCLDSNNFKETSIRRKSRHRGGTNEGDETVSYSPLPERRDALYRKVVAPLFWLATEGFKETDEVPVVPLGNKIQRKSTFTDDEEIQSFWNEIRQNREFHSGISSGTPNFLENLQRIAQYILQCRRKLEVTTPIRVAILDTGCQRDLPFFQPHQRSIRFKRWKDFTSTGSENETDTFGHGTFMARLLMHVAPIVDVYLIRVAENTEDLENNQENIARAIEHAGLDPDWKVDVISMSFGFPKEPDKTYPVISDAIEKVRKERKGSVLFLASAGNSWEGTQNFPASHQNVIPIYAGDSKGQFLASTPAQGNKGLNKLGTWGKDIPPAITEEVSVHFPEADLSAGTSIATAIAAGIVAMTLSYIAIVPSVFKYKTVEEMCAKFYTKEGMEQMLYNMSLETRPLQHFINPVYFWGQKQGHAKFWESMCSASDRMDKG